MCNGGSQGRCRGIREAGGGQEGGREGCWGSQGGGAELGSE